MKKLLIAIFALCILFFSNAAHAQIKTIKPTKKNVLKWAKESQQQLEKMATKLDRSRPANQKDREIKLIIHSAQQRITLILQQGKKLKPKDAREHDKWFRQKIAGSTEECLGETPGNECCFSCPNGGGWENFWCKANCFVFSIPGL